MSCGTKISRQDIDNFAVDIVLHLASAMDPRLACHLIKALGERRKASGNDVCFIHVCNTVQQPCRRAKSYRDRPSQQSQHSLPRKMVGLSAKSKMLIRPYSRRKCSCRKSNPTPFERYLMPFYAFPSRKQTSNVLKRRLLLSLNWPKSMV